jgi:hypothetical protein
MEAAADKAQQRPILLSPLGWLVIEPVMEARG